MNSVYVVGSINNDVVVDAERHPKLGETVFGNSINCYPGGKGANQAVAAAKAGSGTKMIGAVGGDSAGSELIEYLEASGIDTTGIVVENNTSTGTAFITVANGDNTIVVVPGANMQLDLDKTDFFKPEASDTLVAQYETPIRITQKAFDRAVAVGAKTILNPAPAADVSDELLLVTNFLIVNEHEFKAIFGVEPSIDNLEKAAQLRSFQGSIVVTLGEEGVIAWIENIAYEVKGERVDTVDSTGAGDCFVGYFAACITRGLSAEECLRRANHAAAISVTRKGAAISIPDYSEL